MFYKLIRVVCSFHSVYLPNVDNGDYRLRCCATSDGRCNGGLVNVFFSFLGNNHHSFPKDVVVHPLALVIYVIQKTLIGLQM
jgi:hypothetical protein